MKIQLIRSATMKITYAGRTILTDPMLAPKDAAEPYAGIARNPTIGLPFQVEDVVGGIDGVVVSHLHLDHFDPAAAEALPKTVPVFCQPGDEARISEQGFQSVTPIQNRHTWEGITINRTEGEHGSGEILKATGSVSGFVLQADGEPSVYWVGDSIWCERVASAIEAFRPGIIITHSGGAILPGIEPIIMDESQTLAVVNASPNSTIVAVHMEALDHCPVTREALRRMAEEASIPPSRLMIPKDGESMIFE
jgi:L-ascorbate metabolism protein UlaG (beta-lactamase superfamily)